MMTRTPYYKVTVEGEDITAWVAPFRWWRTTGRPTASTLPSPTREWFSPTP